MLAKIWRRDKSRNTTLGPLPVLLSLFVGVILFFGIYFYFPSSSAKITAPVYEEIFSTATDVTAGIREIDYAIYESLYLSGTPEKDVSFLSVEPRHQAGHFWDFTEILVRCIDPSSALRLKQVMVSKLAALGQGTRVRSDRYMEGGSVFHVFSKNFYTHKISLRLDRSLPFTSDARPKVAIIIDDLGYDQEVDLSFVRSGLPLSFSVLPFAPFAGPVLREAGRSRCEVVLHLPLEPKGYPYVDPGPGALLLSMNESEIRQVLAEDLREISSAQGVNNHMGSSFTENSGKMLIVLEELKKRGLFFIDSRTTSKTVGLKLAREIGLPAARRNVFLDNNLAHRAIEMQLERLMNMSRRSGSAIGIAHPHKETRDVLKKYRPWLEKEFQVVTASELAGRGHLASGGSNLP